MTKSFKPIFRITNRITFFYLAIRRNLLIKEHGLSNRQANALGHILEHGSLTIQ